MIATIRANLLRWQIEYHFWTLDLLDDNQQPIRHDIVRRIYGLQLRLMALRKKLQA